MEPINIGDKVFINVKTIISPTHFAAKGDSAKVVDVQGDKLLVELDHWYPGQHLIFRDRVSLQPC